MQASFINSIKNSIKILLVLGTLLVGASVLYAQPWSPPSGNPTSSNTLGPIYTGADSRWGATEQFKEGSLGLGISAVSDPSTTSLEVGGTMRVDGTLGNKLGDYKQGISIGTTNVPVRTIDVSGTARIKMLSHSNASGEQAVCAGSSGALVPC